eukprot:TRINITY_DN6289_c0_g5_i1.p1 TRINITY_DN6289_c0_g5~~TRINITY_DN6289_c0_g5_i1.p1  ORF type:complete len:709 (-),score=136.88 TRINITY_DN6289_c0_g5_i1:116-2242(-)
MCIRDRMKFIHEDTNKEVILHEITDKILYERDKGTTISWQHKDTEEYMALSFQNQEGADQIWRSIQELQNRGKMEEEHQLEKESPNLKFIRSDIDDEDGLSSDSLDSENLLPLPSVSNLSKIEQELIVAGLYQAKRVKIAQMIANRPNFLAKLQEVFIKAEEEKAEEALHLLYLVVRAMVNLAEFELLDVLMDDKNFLFIFGVLEYDPEIREKTKIPHRTFFKEHAHYLDVVEIKEAFVLREIHMNFRLLYLRDCALGHYLDERSLIMVTSIVQENYMEIVKYIQGNKDVMRRLFDQLRQYKMNALRFIHEVCSVIKPLMEIDKSSLLETFDQYNLFELLDGILKELSGATNTQTKPQKGQKKTKENLDHETNTKTSIRLSLEILSITLAYAPHLLRTYSTSQQEKVLKFPFLTFVTDNALSNPDFNEQISYWEILKGLLETGESEKSQQYMELFCNTFLGKLLSVFDEKQSQSTEVVSNSRYAMLEMLLLCVKNYKNYREAFNNLRVIERISTVFDTKEKHLIVHGLQLFMAMLQNKDEANLEQLKQPLKKILDFWLASQAQKRQGAFNLISSQIFYILMTTYNEEVTTLTQYLNETYGDMNSNPIFESIMIPINRRLAYEKERKLVKPSPINDKEVETKTLFTVAPDQYELNIENVIAQNIAAHQQLKKHSTTRAREDELEEHGPKDYKLRKLDEEGTSVKIPQKK